MAWWAIHLMPQAERDLFDETILRSLPSPNQNGLALQVHVGEVQAEQFLLPEAGVKEGGYEGVVSAPLELAGPPRIRHELQEARRVLKAQLPR